MMWIIIVFALVPNAILPGLLGTAAILEYVAVWLCVVR